MPQPYEPGFSDLLELLARMIEVTRQTPLTADALWEKDAQVLAIKVFRHACSLKQLSEGGTLKLGDGLEASFIDHASLKAVARAQLETLLVFFYVFGSGDADLTAYRHMIWKLGGVTDRLKFNATTAVSKATQQVDQHAADALIAQISQLDSFKAEISERRKYILLGEWRRKLSWQGLGEAAGFHPVYFRDVYSYLCSYSHSSWLSVLQISKAKGIQQQADMAGAIMGIATSALARFIHIYLAFFPVANAAPVSTGAQKALEYWAFGKAEMAKHYGKGAGPDGSHTA